MPDYNDAQTTSESPIAVSTATSEQHDMALEYDCMVLLSQIEQGIARLNDKLVQASDALVLEYLTEIINYIAEFIERLPSPQLRRFTLTVLLHKDQQSYTHLRPQHIRNNRLLYDPLVQISLTGNAGFMQVIGDLQRLIRIALLLTVKAFQTPKMAEQWRKLFGGFFGHITQTIEDMKQSN